MVKLLIESENIYIHIEYEDALIIPLFREWYKKEDGEKNSENFCKFLNEKGIKANIVQ